MGLPRLCSFPEMYKFLQILRKIQRHISKILSCCQSRSPILYLLPCDTVSLKQPLLYSLGPEEASGLFRIREHQSFTPYSDPHRPCRSIWICPCKIADLVSHSPVSCQFGDPPSTAFCLYTGTTHCLSAANSKLCNSCYWGNVQAAKAVPALVRVITCME